MRRLILGDCLEAMSKIAPASIDMILADLPYGTTQCKWDIVIPFAPMWEHFKRLSKPNTPILLFAQTPFDKMLGASNIAQLRYEWIWEKTQATGHYNANRMPMKAHENILVFYDKLPIYNPQKTEGHKPVNSYTRYIHTQNNTQVYGKASVEISGGGETDRHPRSVLTFATDKQKNRVDGTLFSTQKPVALCEYFINTYTYEGMSVLDCTAGSMTTAIAAINTDRSFICIEKDTDIYTKGRQRVVNYINSLKQF